MGPYNIYLGNPHGLEYGWKELQEEVDKLFTPAVKGSIAPRRRFWPS